MGKNKLEKRGCYGTNQYIKTSSICGCCPWYIECGHENEVKNYREHVKNGIERR